MKDKGMLTNSQVVLSTLLAFPLGKICCDDENQSIRLRLCHGRSALMMAEQEDRTPGITKPHDWSCIGLCSACYLRGKSIYSFFIIIFKDFKVNSIPLWRLNLQSQDQGSHVLPTEPTRPAYIFFKLLIFGSLLAAIPIS